MKILCIFSRYPLADNDSNITKDLARELSSRGHEVVVSTLLEKKLNKKTFLSKDGDVQVLNIRAGNMFDTVSYFEKFITSLLLPYTFYRSIKKYFGQNNFDLIIAHTPFMADHKLISFLKRLFGCKALLILWDIFPQNALDIGLIKKGILYKWLKLNEKKMFGEFDLISCMSEGNKRYLLENYPYLSAEQLFVCYNWAKDYSLPILNRSEVRKKFGFSNEDKICVFGGNLGKPQKVENIVKLAKLTISKKNIKYLFIGKGTELYRLKNIVRGEDIDNIKIIDFVRRDEYQKLIMACDLGLVSLDENFTVPNFPSKTVDYFRCGLPVFALLDEVSAKDYGSFIQEKAEAGSFILAKEIEKNLIHFLSLVEDDDRLSKFSKNAKSFFRRELDVSVAVKKIENITYEFC